MLVELRKNNVLVSRTIAELRNKNTPPPQFRRALRRLGRYLAYEAARFMEPEPIQVETPLGIAQEARIKPAISVLAILRAALPMADGVLEELDYASIGVISASRGAQVDENGRDFKIEGNYEKLPDLENSVTLIVDPMLASGSTISHVVNRLSPQVRKQTMILCAIASEYGAKRLLAEYPDLTILAGAVDETLNSHGYIVPGLGDAGDRAFNTVKS